jgi:hypothetical protein
MKTSATLLTDLRARVAERDEDLRIARKHREEAAARTMSAENHRAYLSALRWEETCAENRRLAGCALRDAIARVEAIPYNATRHGAIVI